MTCHFFLFFFSLLIYTSHCPYQWTGKNKISLLTLEPYHYLVHWSKATYSSDSGLSNFLKSSYYFDHIYYSRPSQAKSKNELFFQFFGISQVTNPVQAKKLIPKSPSEEAIASDSLALVGNSDSIVPTSSIVVRLT